MNVNINYFNKYYTKIKTTNFAIINNHDNYFFVLIFLTIKLLALNNV